MIAFIWCVWAVSLAVTAVFGQTAALRYLILLLPFCVIASSAATFLASRKITFSVAIKESGTKLIITVDNGISNIDEVKDEKKMNKKDKEQMMIKLEKEMHEAAKNLDFERATELRDILFEMREKNK